MSLRSSLLIASILVLVASVTRAAPGASNSLPMLAVLEIEASSTKDLPEDELLLITDALRSAVVDEVGGRFKVLTRETMADLVPPERMKCFVDKCAAEIGRMLQAPYVIAGNVRKLGTKLVLTVEGYESMGGRLLGTRQFRGASTEDLFEALENKGRAMVRQWLPAGTADGSPSPRAETPEPLAISFTSTPPQASVEVDDAAVCAATPCTHALAPGEHRVTMRLAGFAEVSRRVSLSALEREVAFTFAATTQTVSVTSTPPGLSFAVDGRPAGLTPLTLNLTAGAHELGLSDRCFEGAVERLVATPGPARTITLVGQPRITMVRLSVTDADGRELRANASIDGRPLGLTPLSERVPLCAREARVAVDGIEATSALALRETDVNEVSLRLPRTAAPAAPAVAEGSSAPGSNATADAPKAPGDGRPSFALRAGMGTQTAVMGVGLEWRPSWWGVSVGTGAYLLSAGLTFGAPENQGGGYIDLSGVWLRPGFFGGYPSDGIGAAANIGWDLRFYGWSLKAGVGVAWNSQGTDGAPPLVYDLNFGRVF